MSDETRESYGIYRRITLGLCSREAAERIYPHVTDLQKRVLKYIHLSEGCTDEQGCTAMCMNPSTWRPRRIELQRKGLIVADGTRKTKSGRNASIWRVI